MMLQALESEPLMWRVMIKLALTTGLRRGELLGLEWKPIDLDDEVGTIDVRQSITYVKDIGYQIKDPKTKKSIRKVSIPSFLLPFPEAHFATFPEKIPWTCILAGSPLGGNVLDPFGGSGTTGVVAKKLGRKYVLIEMGSHYIQLAEKLENGNIFMSGQQGRYAVIIEKGKTISSGSGEWGVMTHIYDLTRLSDGKILAVGSKSKYLLFDKDGKQISEGLIDDVQSHH
ncbi:DNA methyltransferase [Brevibacillus formosus]|uniref:site-specific integrase n=1 Tax=Brevibacillus formosus TaxID=54913 RepID=UPI003F199E77